MIVFAILVGMITESVETAVQLADGERSRVVISDHILVCGWSPHVTQILQGVNNVSSKVRVVVLASPREKVAMMDSIRSSLTEKQRRGMRIFFRTGAPIVLEDLKRVSADRAKKIILVKNLTGDAVDADRLVLSRAMAIRQNLPAFSGDIVAEVNSQRDEDLLQSIMADSNIKSVETINAEQLLFHFMAQAIRQPGLADVAAQLMGDNPNTIFHVAPAKEVAPNLIGTRFADARPSSVAGSILCGFFSADGAVHIDTGSKFSAAGHIIRDDTDLLLLGTSQSSFGGQKYSNNFEKISQPMVSMMRSFNAAGEKALKPAPESYLVCGWRKDMRSMLSELDTVLTRGSSVTIIDEDAPDTLSLNLKNIKVSCVQKRADRYENLEALIGAKSNQFHHVVLLGSAIGDDSELRSRMGRDEDTKTLASLVYINELLSKQQEAFSKKKWDFESTMVTVEFINERVAAIAKEQGNVANAILPQNLSAKIAAQTVRDNRLNVVWRELLSQKGREIYLRPCRMYKDIVGERLSFGVIGDSLAKEGEDLLLGYISRDGKVSINPQGSEKVKNRMWNPSDMLIVLSHD